MTIIIDPPKRSERTEQWWNINSKLNKPNLFTAFILLFLPRNEVLDPDANIFSYKKLNNKCYYLKDTGYRRISLQEYNKSFGIN